jgi:2-haloacid dehalogenase
MADGIAALLFDVFGTVVDWRSGVVRDVAGVARQCGITVDVEAFADAWQASYAPAMNEVRRGELPWVFSAELFRRYKPDPGSYRAPWTCWV